MTDRNQLWISPHGKVFELRRNGSRKFEMWREMDSGRVIMCRTLRGCKTLADAIERLLSEGYERAQS